MMHVDTVPHAEVDGESVMDALCVELTDGREDRDDDGLRDGECEADGEGVDDLRSDVDSVAVLHKLAVALSEPVSVALPDAETVGLGDTLVDWAAAAVTAALSVPLGDRVAPTDKVAALRDGLTDTDSERDALVHANGVGDVVEDEMAEEVRVTVGVSDTERVPLLHDDALRDILSDTVAFSESVLTLVTVALRVMLGDAVLELLALPQGVTLMDAHKDVEGESELVAERLPDAVCTPESVARAVAEKQELCVALVEGDLDGVALVHCVVLRVRQLVVVGLDDDDADGHRDTVPDDDEQGDTDAERVGVDETLRDPVVDTDDETLGVWLRERVGEVVMLGDDEVEGDIEDVELIDLVELLEADITAVRVMVGLDDEDIVRHEDGDAVSELQVDAVTLADDVKLCVGDAVDVVQLVANEEEDAVAEKDAVTDAVEVSVAVTLAVDDKLTTKTDAGALRDTLGEPEFVRAALVLGDRLRESVGEFDALVDEETVEEPDTVAVHEPLTVLESVALPELDATGLSDA